MSIKLTDAAKFFNEEGIIFLDDINWDITKIDDVEYNKRIEYVNENYNKVKENEKNNSTKKEKQRRKKKLVERGSPSHKLLTCKLLTGADLRCSSRYRPSTVDSW